MSVDPDWRDYVVDEYQKNKSMYALGRELGKNPKVIRDVLLRANVAIRTRSGAQKLYVKENGPPVKGPRTKAEKRSISRGMRKHWGDLTEKERTSAKKKIAKTAKSRWKKLSKKEKDLALYTMREGARAQSGTGSKAENTIGNLLMERGFNVEKRSKTFTYPLEIDILIIGSNTCIECDGPTHFSNLYGELALEKTQQRDKIKDDFVTSLGLHMVRVQDHTKSFSFAACEVVVDEIIKVFTKIKNGASPAVWLIQMK
jgi:very-short-patch-repair endonuclease